MIRWTLAPIFLLAAAKSVWADGLTSLPPEIADQAQTAAFNYAWAATNERMGPQGDVAQNQLAAQDAIDKMKKLAKGLLSESLIDEFKWLAFNAGWCAANRRAGHRWGWQGLLDDADTNEGNMEEHHKNMVDAGVLDEYLIWNLHLMSNCSSWYAADTRIGGLDDDAKTQKTYYEHFAELIHGEVALLSIDFDANAGKMSDEEPAVVGQEALDNSQSGSAESMTFAYSYTNGHTYSYSNTIGFKVTVATDIKVGFMCGVETKMSFEGSYSGTWASGSSDGTTKSYSFPLSVPAHRIYQAKATVQQATMEVPYTMKMSIGDYQWTTSGTWYGMAVSMATYKVVDVTPNSTAAVVLI